MKCYTCKYFFYKIIPNEAEDAIPNVEIHCSKLHWEDDCPEGLDEDEFITYDPWKNCPDYNSKL